MEEIAEVYARSLFEVAMEQDQLDEDTVKGIGQKIEEQTGQRVELSAQVDPTVIGGLVIRVGNMVLDASVRNRLERLRRQVASAA